jgi:hypothetical protein
MMIMHLVQEVIMHAHVILKVVEVYAGNKSKCWKEVTRAFTRIISWTEQLEQYQL